MQNITHTDTAKRKIVHARKNLQKNNVEVATVTPKKIDISAQIDNTLRDVESLKLALQNREIQNIEMKNQIVNEKNYYEKILNENINDDKISLLKILIHLSHIIYSEDTITYCKLLLSIVAKNSRDLFYLFEILAECYQDSSSTTQKEDILESLKQCLSVIDSLDQIPDLYAYCSDNEKVELLRICFDQIPYYTIVLAQKANKHIENKDWKSAINAYEQLLSLVSSENKINIIKASDFIYNIEYQEPNQKIANLNKVTSKIIIELFFDLILICRSKKNTEKGIEYCKEILAIKDIDIRDKLDALGYLIDFSTDINKHIECYIAMLEISNISNEVRFLVRKKLSISYLKIDNIDKAMEYYKETIRMESIKERLLIDDLFNFFHEENKFNLPIALKTLNENYKTRILKILARNPGLWCGKYKLTEDQWGKIINLVSKENNAYKIFDAIFSNYVSFQNAEYNWIINDTQSKTYYLNGSSFLKKDIQNWNALTQRKGLITEDILNDSIANLKNIFDFYKMNPQNKEDLDTFVYRCCEDRNEMQMQFVTKRIIAVIDILEDYFSQLNNNKSKLSLSEIENIQKIIQGAIDIIIDGGKKCADLASTALDDVEMFLMIFKNPQSRANIFVNLFKLYAIQIKLTDQNQEEQLETRLYYATKFNSLLQLGLQDDTMLFREYAIVLPLEEALSILSNAFTAEMLINFTMASHLFRMIFEMDEEVSQELKLLRAAYDDTFNIEDENEQYQKGAEILSKIDFITDRFYINKAIKMYLDSDLLLEKQ